jgi:hypothetical protein
MDDWRDEMDVIDERGLIYVAVLLVCSALAVFAGPARAAATFGVVAASIEGAFWLGGNLAQQYCAHRRGGGEPVLEVLDQKKPCERRG